MCNFCQEIHRIRCGHNSKVENDLMVNFFKNDDLIELIIYSIEEHSIFANTYITADQMFLVVGIHDSLYIHPYDSYLTNRDELWYGNYEKIELELTQTTYLLIEDGLLSVYKID